MKGGGRAGDGLGCRTARSHGLGLTPLPPPSPIQELESAAAREIARKERERLKQQDKLRREQLERMRMSQNQDASKGEVRSQ